MPQLEGPLLGETAALATSAMWAFTAIFFTLGSLRIGSYTVNRIRLLAAVVFLAALNGITTGNPLPTGASGAQWAWLGLSGLVGLTLGDTLLFQSYVELGAQRAMLIMAAWPILAALMAFLFLGEHLTPTELAGVALTIGSIAWVVWGRQRPAVGEMGRNPGRGSLLAFGGAVCQAAGVLLAKEGLAEGFSPLTGTLIRMLCAAAGLWAVALFRRDAKDAFYRLRDRRGALFTVCGAITGPTLGVWFSLVAVAYGKVGVVTALMSLPPVLLIPLGRIVFGDRITLRAVAGTAGALLGVWLLILR